MFSQGRGAGLSPGTSAHNPSAFSEPAKETERGKRRGRRGGEGRVPRLREPASSVTAVSMMKAMTSERNNEKQQAEGGSRGHMLPVCKVNKKYCV